jgi:hypothetical protein
MHMSESTTKYDLKKRRQLKDVSELAHARQNKDNDNEIKHVSHYYSC